LTTRWAYTELVTTPSVNCLERTLLCGDTDQRSRRPSVSSRAVKKQVLGAVPLACEILGPPKTTTVNSFSPIYAVAAWPVEFFVMSR